MLWLFQASEEEDEVEDKDEIDKLPLSSSHDVRGWSSTVDGECCKYVD